MEGGAGKGLPGRPEACDMPRGAKEGEGRPRGDPGAPTATPECWHRLPPATPVHYDPALVSGTGIGFVSGSLAGRVFPLGPRVLIGRDPRAEVALSPDEGGVSTRHAQVAVASSGVTITDLQSRGGTFLNGERIAPNEAIPLPWGSVVRFGSSGPVAVLEALLALEEGGSQLVVRREGGNTWRVDGPLFVGRDASCQIHLDPQKDSVASSRHLHLVPAFGRVVATDLGSANGTWLRGKRLAQALLGPGDAATLGQGGPVLRIEREDLAARRKAPTEPRIVVRPETEGPVKRVPVPKPTPAPRLEAPVRLVGVSMPGSSLPGGSSAQRPAPSPQPAARRPEPALPAPKVPSLRHETLRLDVTAPGGVAGRVHLVMKTEVHFGAFAALNDLVLRCFPRELESDNDALDRSESIAPQHGTFVLSGRGVDLVDAGAAPLKLNGRKVEPAGRLPLGELNDIVLGDDVLGLRGRLFAHPRLQAREPVLGMEGMHPVESLVLERKGDGADHLYVMLVRQATIGSADDCAIVVPTAGVGAMHALLFIKDGQCWISQLGADPVAVGDVALSAGMAVPLAPGMKVYVGPAVILVGESSPEDFHPAPGA